MCKRVLFVAALLPLLVACQSVDHGPQPCDVTSVAFPRGDAGAGRDVFVSLGCASCHSVAWDDDLPVPVSGNPGPELVAGLGRRAPGDVVTAILEPSHDVPVIAGNVEGSLSPMADFTESMTVRQLIDLVAYVRSGEEHIARLNYFDEFAPVTP